MIERNHPQYVDIENFEDHELTICIAYEMAIRSSEVIDIINKNLEKNIQWYMIDKICRVNKFLNYQNIALISKHSDTKKIYKKIKDPEIQAALWTLVQGNDQRIFFTRLMHNDNEHEHPHLKIVQEFYDLVIMLRRDLEDIHIVSKKIDFGSNHIDLKMTEGLVSFDDAFIRLKDIDFIEDDEASQYFKYIQDFYNDLKQEEQDIIKTMIALNIDQSKVVQKHNILYNISDEDALVLRDKYYLDTFNDDGIASMMKLHLSYSFINIFDERFTYDQHKDEFILRDNHDASPAIWLDEKIPILEQKRPLLKSDSILNTISNVVFSVPDKEFEAQMSEIRKQYNRRQKAIKNLNLSSLFELNEEYGEIVPLKNKARLADMFFLYDNMIIHTQNIDKIRKKYNKDIADLNAYKKRQEHLGRDSLDDDPGSMSYDDKKKTLKEKMQLEIEQIKEDFDYNFKNELMKYHDKVQIDSPSGKKILSYSEYELLQDTIDETIVFFPDMKSSSFGGKYNTMKQFIEEGRYKKLF